MFLGLGYKSWGVVRVQGGREDQKPVVLVGPLGEDFRPRLHSDYHYGVWYRLPLELELSIDVVIRCGLWI